MNLTQIKYKLMGYKDKCYNLFRNLYIFRNTLLTHRWYDYAGVYVAVEDALKDMHKMQKESNTKVNTEKYCKEMEVVLEALKHLTDPDYNLSYENSEEHLQDRKIVAKMFEDQLENYWD